MSLPSRRRLWHFFESLFTHELHEASPKAPQPEWIQTRLLDHQASAMAAALSLEEAKEGKDVNPLPGEEFGGRLFTTYGILGDRVGSGKSLTALSLVRHPPPSQTVTEYIWRMNGKSYMDGNVGLLRKRNIQEAQTYQMMRAALFIIPHSLMGQWETYVEKDTTLRCYFVKKRKDVTEEGLEDRLGTYDAVFVSATMWRDFSQQFNTTQRVWSRVFIDEADTISVSHLENSVRGNFFWFISASWMNLIFSDGAYVNIGHSLLPLPETPEDVVTRVKAYSTGEPHHMINFNGIRNAFIKRMCGDIGLTGYNVSLLNPVMMQSSRLVIQNREAYIQRSFTIPDIHHTYVLCQTPPNIQILRNLVSDAMMERLHAGDTMGVLTMLGMQSRSADEIITAVSDTIEKDLRQVRELYAFKSRMEYATEGAKQKALESLATRIQGLENRVQAIRDRLTNSQDQTCPICFSDVQTPALTPCCRNLFCFGCICEVLKRTCVCPMCRATIPSVQTMLVLGDRENAAGAAAAPTPTRLHTKQEQLRALLREQPEARVLMFSGYDASFQELSALLEADGVPHATLQGSQARITRLLRQFGEGAYRVLFLNAGNMGAGLNIPQATHVVLYHRMTMDVQNQIIGRAMRMGRQQALQVVHLVHGNEMTGVESAVATVTAATTITTTAITATAA